MCLSCTFLRRRKRINEGRFAFVPRQFLFLLSSSFFFWAANMWSQTSHYSWHTGRSLQVLFSFILTSEIKKGQMIKFVFDTVKKTWQLFQKPSAPRLASGASSKAYFFSTRAVLWILNALKILCFLGVIQNTLNMWQGKSDDTVAAKAGRTDRGKRKKKKKDEWFSFMYLLNWMCIYISKHADALHCYFCPCILICLYLFNWWYVSRIKLW